MIYLDNNATTRPSAGVVEAVSRAMRETWGNPSSVHRMGMEAKRALEGARAQVAGLIGARARGVVFTGSGTEAIAMALRGSLLAQKGMGRDTVVTSRVEHAAVRDLGEALGREGAGRVVYADVDREGRVDADSVAGLIDARTGVVSVQWVNNETGTVQDIARIGALCAEKGVVFHCDATQRVGKDLVDVMGDPESGGGIGMLTCSAHKFHGPKGVGVVWARPGVRMVPVTPGSQELGRRGGTEALAAIVGAGAAAEEARVWLEDDGGRARMGALRDRLERGIVEGCADLVEGGVVVNGAGAARIWNTTNLGFARLEAEALLLAMSERGLCASAGAACSSGSLDPSPVLLAMGVEEKVAHGSVRLSLSRETTEDEVEKAIGVVVESVRVVGRSMV